VIVALGQDFARSLNVSFKKTTEKTVIDQVVNGANLSGLVDSAVMKKLVAKIVKNQPVKFSKYAKQIKKQIKQSTKPQTFKKNFKKVAETLKLVAGASSAKDLKVALRKLASVVRKAKASTTVKASIRKLARNFKKLAEAKKGKKSEKDSRKIRKAAKTVKRYIKVQDRKIARYVIRIEASRKQVQVAIVSLKRKAIIKKKTEKKINKLQKILASLEQVLNILKNTEKDIRATLEVIRKTAAKYKN